ncbi:MAG: hypothetical protein WC455_26630 [Dehalococcoidia bacterium]
MSTVPYDPNLYEHQVRCVAVSGDRTVSPRVAGLLSCLTRRQRRIARLLSEGCTQAEAARRVGVLDGAVSKMLRRMRDRAVRNGNAPALI